MTKLILFILLLPSIIFSQLNLKVTNKNSKLIKLFDGGFFTEGPAYGPDGNVYFSDLTFTSETNMQAGIIWKYDSQSGKTSVYRSPSGMANGIDFDKSGSMIVCEGADFGGRKITSTDLSTGIAKILTALYNGVPYNSPNDLVIDSQNRIYFTDPRYSGYENIEQSCLGVYRLDPDGKVTLLIADIPMPNGIAISPKEDKIYIGCNFEGNYEMDIKPATAIYIYDLDINGKVSNGKIFLNYPDEYGPDGMTIDKEGNIYVALRDESDPGIYIYDSDAELIDKIPLTEVPSNVTFGKGKDKNYLFITAGGSLYKINVLAEGIN
jgi:gluconolactonase